MPNAAAGSFWKTMSRVPGFAALVLIGINAGWCQTLPSGIVEVAPGVWFLQHTPGQGYCNNVFIEMRDFLIVVDANFPGGARVAMLDAKRLSPKPVKYVFDTHHHGDHLYGNAVWSQAGAITLAHAGVLDEIRRYEPEEWRLTAKRRPDVADLRLDAPEPPQKTFPDAVYAIDDGTRRVEFRHYGWGHTRGDGFVFLPKEKILCTGDAVVNGAYNFTRDASLANWIKVIAETQKLDVERVLPGHGPPGGKELLEGQKKFFMELQAQVAKAVQQGRKLKELVTFTDGKASSTTIELSKAVSNWVSSARLPGQVYDFYSEITSGKPVGELPHNGPAPR